MTATRNILAIGLLAASQVFAETAPFLADYATQNVFLTAGFIPDSTNVMVGEPLFVTFVASNRADRPFQFSHVRSEIFTVEATNAAGVAAKRGYFGLDGNGFMKQESVAPGTTYTYRIFLGDRFRIEEPGEYTVTCRCDFGYFGNRTNALGRPVVTVFPLTVAPFDPARLAKVIDAWGRVAETNAASVDAAKALASVDDPRTIEHLARLVLTGGEVGYLAVSALARYTNSAAADALVPVLQGGEDYLAGLAGTALRKSGQADRIARAFVPGLASPDAAARIQAARAVSWTGASLAFAPLCALLQDGSNEVRYAAAVAIGRLGDSRSFGVLTNCLSAADFAFRIAAVNGLRALGRAVEPEWVTPMILGGGENIRTYYDAIDLLRMYGGDKAAPGLARCVHFDDPSVRHSYNFRLMLALEFSPNGPKHYYQWHHDPNRDGSEEELADNRRILAELKTWLDQQSGQRK
jgi:hypothetical protein